MKTLSHEAARAFYDRVGAWQDSQAFYEDRAIESMVEHSDFDQAEAVIELGCGTGRLALRLLSRELPENARYLGLDASPTMVGLASARVAPYGDRARVCLTGGPPHLPATDDSIDRVVSTYVTDLLSEEDVTTFIEESHRVLVPGGRVCLVGITPGHGLLGRTVSSVWTAVQAWRPALVGGCRPLELAPRLQAAGWSLRHQALVQSWGVSSEILVAGPPEA